MYEQIKMKSLHKANKDYRLIGNLLKKNEFSPLFSICDAVNQDLNQLSAKLKVLLESSAYNAPNKLN